MIDARWLPWLAIGALSAGVSVLNWATDPRGGRHRDAIHAAFLMNLVWIISTAEYFLPAPNGRLIGPLMDVAFIAWIVDLIMRRRGRVDGWMVWLAGLLAAQALAHLVYMVNHLALGVLTRYILILNLTYVVELIAVGWPGGCGVADRLRGTLRLSGDLRSPVGARRVSSTHWRHR